MRKYMTEFTLSTYASSGLLIEANQLNMIEWPDNKYHIYMILGHPVIYTKPGEYRCTKEFIEVGLYKTVNGIETPLHPLRFALVEGIDHSIFTPSSSYPYDSISLTSPNGKTRVFIQQLYDKFVKYMKYLEFDVFYVGQSYGKEGSRNALDRLSSHSTLQDILLGCQSRYSDRFIYLLLLEFDYRIVASMDGTIKEFSKTDSEDKARIEKVISTLSQEMQVINITEAALINHFKPEYNEKFVENFPAPEHKSYRHYYDCDYRDIVVELNISFDPPPIKLNTNSASFNLNNDMIHYDLNNDDTRYSMYDIFNPSRIFKPK